MNTLNMLVKDKCTGCNACGNSCPVDAIKLVYNKEGFLYPEINQSKCVDCGKCISTCPSLSNRVKTEKGTCYAFMASDEIRQVSSSGGAFTLIAEYVFRRGGVVFGAVFTDDYFGVIHSKAENTEELSKLRGSKYIQSNVGLTYREVKECLEDDRYVLFSGTPCQIAGLRAYLGRDYEKLYTCDLICHGVISSTAYKTYIDEISRGREVERVVFRDKDSGWKSILNVYFTDGTEFVEETDKKKSPFYLGYYNGITARKSCFDCEYAHLDRPGDISIGDFWKINTLCSEMNDKKGTSLILVNSNKGRALFDEIKDNAKAVKEIELDYGFCKKANGNLVKSMSEHPGRTGFFDNISKKGYEKALNDALKVRKRYDIGVIGNWQRVTTPQTIEYFALGLFLQKITKNLIFVSNQLETESSGCGFIRENFEVSKKRTSDELVQINGFCNDFVELNNNPLEYKEGFASVGHSVFTWKKDYISPILLAGEDIRRRWSCNNSMGTKLVLLSKSGESVEDVNPSDVISKIAKSGSFASDIAEYIYIAVALRVPHITYIGNIKDIEILFGKFCIKGIAVYKNVAEYKKSDSDFTVDYSEYEAKLSSAVNDAIYDVRTGLRKKNYLSSGKTHDIGIVGYWWSSNYGSVATYWALYRTLEKLGYNPLFLEYPGRNIQKSFSYDFMAKRCDITGNDMDVSEYNRLCDTFVIGSDQVWSPGAISAYDYFFFLDFADSSKRKVAYAASFGENFDTDDDRVEKAGHFLERVNALSVREYQGRDILKKLFGKSSKWVLDPVFLIGIEEYRNFAKQSTVSVSDILGKDEPFILSYFLDASEEKKEMLLYLSKVLKMPTINVISAKEETKQGNREVMDIPNTLDTIGEEEWFYLYSKCSYVLTDSFHGTAFSIIFNKPFINCSVKKWGYSRFVSLLGMLNLKYRMVSDFKEFYDRRLWETEIDYDAVEKIISEKRSASLSWLEDSINE